MGDFAWMSQEDVVPGTRYLDHTYTLDLVPEVGPELSMHPLHSANIF